MKIGIRSVFLKITKIIVSPVCLSTYRKVNNVVRKPFVKRKLSSHTKLHLACGNHIMEGWANIDLNGINQVVEWDLTNRLPILPGTIEFIYSEHFIEHITLSQGRRLLTECYEALRIGGVIRISTPNLHILIGDYFSFKTGKFLDVGWNPKTPCQLINEGMRLWGHQFVYDLPELKQMLTKIGFRKIIEQKWHESSYQALKDLECRPFHGEIILEAIK